MSSIWINLMQGIYWWYLFHKWVKRSFSTVPDIFEPPIKCSIFKCISCFFGVNIGIFWKRESRPIEWRQCRLSNCQVFFCLHIYGLYMIAPYGGWHLPEVTSLAHSIFNFSARRLVTDSVLDICRTVSHFKWFLLMAREEWGRLMLRT
jgi:hypothetical protein